MSQQCIDQHQKYSIRSWPHYGSHETSYLPDHIMDRIVKTLTPYMEASRSTPAQYKAFKAPETMACLVSMEAALQNTQETLDSLSGRFKDCVQIAQKAGHLKITPSLTHGQGYCPNENIFWEFDHSINNAIYFSHEFGHKIGNTGGVGKPPENITEWQGHFAQIAELDRLASQQTMGPDSARVAYNHRHLEIFGDLRNLDNGLQSLNKIKNHHIISDKDNKQAQFIHYHATAMFVALALYQKFKFANVQEKEQMIDALYLQGAKSSPEQILNGFGLLEEGALEEAIKSELKSINFNPVQQVAPKPQILENI